MNLPVIVACVFRAFAVIHFELLLTGLLYMGQYGGMGTAAPAIAAYLGSAIMGVLCGATWIFAGDLARWSLAGGRSHVETAMKVVAIVGVLIWTGRAVHVLLYWLAYRASEPEVYESAMTWVGGESGVTACVGVVVLAGLLLFLARPVGRWVAFNERMRELRQSE